MTKTSLLTLVLVASLSATGAAQAFGIDIMQTEPRTESSVSSVDIGSVFHNTDNGSGSVDIQDVFHNTDNNSDLPITIYDLPGKGDIGLTKPPTGGIGTVKVGSDGTAGSNQAASANRDKLVLVLDCTVAGTPSEFPDDLRITNAGSTTIPTGTQIKWQTQAPRLTGSAVFAAPLKAGKSVRINGVLAGGVEAGTPCAAKIIGL